MSDTELSEARTKLHRELGVMGIEKTGLDRGIEIARGILSSIEGLSPEVLGETEYKLQNMLSRRRYLTQAIEQACIAFNMAYQETGTKT